MRTMKILRPQFLMVMLLFLVAASVSAQKQRQYIYLFDCTESMKGFKIWDPAKQWLKEDIERQADDASIVVIPFRDNPDKIISFVKSDFKWKDLEPVLDSLISSRHKYTGICRAWDHGLKNLDRNKENYFYLLTDGEDGYDGTASLQNRMRKWCDNRTSDYGFFVTLSDDAELVLTDLNVNCDRFFTLDGSGHLPPFGAFTPNQITVNLRNIKEKQLDFSTYGEFKVKPECDDPNFKVEIKDNLISNGKTAVKVIPKKDVSTLVETLSEKYTFVCNVVPEKKDGESVVAIQNNPIEITVDNRPVRNLNIISEEQSGEGDWYDSFLCWGAKEPDTIRIALDNTWNELAKKYGSTLKIHVKTDKLKKGDYTLLLNGKPVEQDAFTLSSGSENDELDIVMATHVDDDTYYFELNASPRDCNKLETINDNDIQTAAYANSLRIDYDVCWNPLKTFLFCLILLLAALALLWFCCLRLLLISRFKVGSLMVMDPYYSNLRINGVRKLVFTSKQKSDSLIKRIFLGKTIYSINPVWTTDLTMEPGMKKSVRMLSTGGKYTVDPYASLLKQGEYTIINNTTNDKVKIMIT